MQHKIVLSLFLTVSAQLFCAFPHSTDIWLKHYNSGETITTKGNGKTTIADLKQKYFERYPQHNTHEYQVRIMHAGKEKPDKQTLEEVLAGICQPTWCFYVSVNDWCRREANVSRINGLTSKIVYYTRDTIQKLTEDYIKEQKLSKADKVNFMQGGAALNHSDSCKTIDPTKELVCFVAKRTPMHGDQYQVLAKTPRNNWLVLSYAPGSMVSILENMYKEKEKFTGKVSFFLLGEAINSNNLCRRYNLDEYHLDAREES